MSLVTRLTRGVASLLKPQVLTKVLNNKGAPTEAYHSGGDASK